jgi:hypothetical protein
VVRERRRGHADDDAALLGDVVNVPAVAVGGVRAGVVVADEAALDAGDAEAPQAVGPAAEGIEAGRVEHDRSEAGVAAAPQDEVAAQHAAAATALEQQGRAVTVVAAEGVERGGGGEHLGVGGGQHGALPVVRVEHLARAGVGHIDAPEGHLAALAREDLFEAGCALVGRALAREHDERGEGNEKRPQGRKQRAEVGHGNSGG